MRPTSELSELVDSVWDEAVIGSNLCVEDIKQMLDNVGIHLPGYKLRDLTEDLNINHSYTTQGLSKVEFEDLCLKLTREDVRRTFKTSKQHDRNGVKINGEMGATHMVLHEEQAAFADWINNHLGHDPDIKHLLKLANDGSDIYEKMDDGVILCKMINLAAPDTIDERVINKGQQIPIFKQHENLTLAINSAKAIGCVVIGIDSHTLNSGQGKKWLVLGLIWQLIKMFLFKRINVAQVPGLIHLLKPGEDVNDLKKLSPEQLLVRWVNHQLEKAGCSRMIRNFSDDIRDSEIYTELISQVAPQGSEVDKMAMTKEDWLERAEIMLSRADKINCRAFVSSRDVVNGHEKLNLAFVANLFNNHPSLDEPDEDQMIDVVEETREEKMFRNWINSLGVSPPINYLYSDLSNGIVILQLEDTINPGIVDWERRVVITEKLSKIRAKRFQECLGNCNYAVEVAKRLNLVVVGIAGSDLYDCNPTLTLAIVWQLMRSYTLALLSRLSSDAETPVSEPEIINWVNSKVKLEMRNFQDKSLRNSVPILKVIETLQPGTIDWSLVNVAANTEEELIINAKYAVTMARRIGAPVYALPEDIVDLRHKMIMTLFASLMLTDTN